MLSIVIPSFECFDERNGTFITFDKSTTLQLEHSLMSISKWEEKWHKPFLDKKPKTLQESIDYVRCMTLNKNVDFNVYLGLTDANMNAINDYMEAPMTATTFSKNANEKSNREIVTSEIIYYWMIALNIPMEFQKWHINKLLTLIRVCNVKNTPPKKMNREESFAKRKALNEARKARMHSSG